ncbi:hypothetical protein [Mesorhizobium sp. M0040]|uniref:hypothetical protein n=1 Tax=Mesorhizobium sp. M0040 TaxID=2956855 RepID=UPI003338E2BA
MGSDSKANSDSNRGIRNPFGFMDVPTPDDEEVSAFAAGVKLEGTPSDENAEAWGTESDRDRNDTIEGSWSSRWNGGADPTIPGDTEDKWKSGRGEVKTAGERVYLLFDWHDGVREGLIDAARGCERAGWKIYQSDRPENRASLGRLDRQQSTDRREMAGRTLGLSKMKAG